MTSSSTARNAGVTDAVDGLQLAVKACTAAYTGSALPPRPAPARSGRFTGVAAAVVSSALVGLNSKNAGGTDYLVFTVSLPTTAGNTFQGLNAPLWITFTGVQRNAAAQ